MASIHSILEKYRKDSFSERDKGFRFERLMQAYLKTDPLYSGIFGAVWLWEEFPFNDQFGGKDTGIDLVAKDGDGNYCAVQCKFYKPGTTIDKPTVDTFLSTSGKEFQDETGLKRFEKRFWISTTSKWNSVAEDTIKNQTPAVNRIGLTDLESAPVDWDKLNQGLYGELALTEKKKLREHQHDALTLTHEHFKLNTRGKLIMACGTGKTFTALRIAENETGGKGLVLFLVPSIALLGQTLREWFTEANEPLKAICVCSDSKVSQKKDKKDDSGGYSIIDLALPATTNIKDIAKQIRENRAKKGITVVFSTYQSIEVISEAQKELAKEDDAIFDIVICDEAHRTTGVTLAETDESAFVKVHDEAFLKAKKRLYMTATPKLYDDSAQSKAAQNGAALCSMDDEKIYGKEIYHIGFGKAVEDELLTDYKVLILTVNENEIPAEFQSVITDSSNEINTNDIAKLIGCINALSKQILGDAGLVKESDPEPMRSALAFCASIKDSQKVTSIYNTNSELFKDTLPDEIRQNVVNVMSDHVDGTMSALTREEKLSWLKSSDIDNNECRILTNARCLSEGIDVPSLDAVIFLSARNSQVDVVQAVGRVMRRSVGKNYGYIIIPVVVPGNVKPENALDDNERYKIVWSVLNALRAHDDRFEATVNKIDLNKKKPGQIIVGRADFGNGERSEHGNDYNDLARQLNLQFEELQGVVYARMVQKVGDRGYWEVWAKSVAEIATRHIERIERLIKESKEHEDKFQDFLKGLQKNINPSITHAEAVEMLSQHIITKPVFDALFEGYSFVQNNAVSLSMQNMLNVLEDQALEKDTETLQKFYDKVKIKAEGIDNAEGKQKIIIELYDKFFKTAFPKMVEKLGIVYTPVECVDFIVYSVDYLLRKEFGRSISDENVHVLDPFTGTGTFITRLLQSGLIKPEDLERKYTHELHANEIVLLAYYIAAINIENAFHDAIGADEYQSFDGICLTDTFQLGETDESEKLFSDMFPKNSERVQKQKKAPLRVIMGNPPYSVGQKSANDNAQNQEYKKLDRDIAKTYAKETDATNKNSLYDSYIKAFRWSTDRLDKDGGMIAFISNGAWLDGNATEGFRKCLEKEFSSIYVFNLRGNQRTSGELSRKEGGKIFGSGSRTPIAITFLVKNPKVKTEKATIHYHDIGDYLSQKEKLEIIRKFGSVDNEAMNWQTLEPNEHGDWISVRNEGFENFISLGDKDNKDNKSIFFNPFFSNGVKTNRDSWCYNSSNLIVQNNIKGTIAFFNEQAEDYQTARKSNAELKVENFIKFESTRITWDRENKSDVLKNIRYKYDNSSIRQALYRPFFKQIIYFNRKLNNCIYQQYKHYPILELNNISICVPAPGGNKDTSCLITNCIPDLHLNGDTQCFSLYYYEEAEKTQGMLFEAESTDGKYIKKDGVSDFILEKARKQYGTKDISKEDIFYYVYGFLHSPEYREKFANDLKKMLPKLPLVEDVRDFWAFSNAGRKLADLHINYETVPAYEGVKVTGADSGHFIVDKMRYPKKDQKDTIIYNSRITIENIPAEAYEYVVNGKSAIDWILERYAVTVHKESGIKNDPNDWATEVGNTRYILDLLLSVINVSVQTVEIVKGLPKMEF